MNQTFTVEPISSFAKSVKFSKKFEKQPSNVKKQIMEDLKLNKLRMYDE